MPMDPELISAVAEGLKSGVESYRSERDRLDKKERDRADDEYRRQLLKFQMAQAGYDGETGERSEIAELKKRKLEAEAMAAESELRPRGLLRNEKGMLVYDKAQDLKSQELQAKIESLKAEPQLKAQRSGLLAGGKQLPPSTVLKVSEGESMPALIGNLEKTISANKDAFGPVAGRLRSMNPYDERGQSIESQMTAAAQAVGKYMEGGVLRAEDVPKYLPNITDTPENAANKLKIVQSMLAEKQARDVNSLQQSGYDTSGFGKSQSPQLPSILGRGMLKPEAQAGAGLRPGTVEDGYEFLGGDPSDPKAWRRVK
jgi:hypothetical protein